MNLAVFADVHGRVLLCFKLCARWERETGERVALILQAGDLGTFPDEARLDKATIRHARDDRSELGFLDHFRRREASAEGALAQTQCPLVYVRGNHEDHAWLDALEAAADGPLVPVDVYQRVYCLKTGVPYTFVYGDEQINILGIGRIGPPVGERDTGKPIYLQDYEMERLYNLDNPPVDVLLTHDAARDSVTVRYGLEEIRWLLNLAKPAYHFYGHTEQPLQQGLDANGATWACKLSDLTWDTSNRGRPVNAGAMGILRWHSRDDHRFEVVEAPWLHEYTASTWLYR